MAKKGKLLSNPISTSGSSTHFENRVQASFALLMLANGYAPCLPNFPIYKIKLQGKHLGYDTDDLIIFTKQPNTNTESKLLGQVKRTISFTPSNKQFKEVIQAAWNDFTNEELFNKDRDIIALICSPISENDTDSIRKLINLAINSEDENDFLNRINLPSFTSQLQRKKFKIIENQLQKSNDNNPLTKKQLWEFLKVFRLLIYDIDIKGVSLSLLHTIIQQFKKDEPNAIWTQIVDVIQWSSEAGVITLDSFPEGIKSIFIPTDFKSIPQEYARKTVEDDLSSLEHHQYMSELAIMCLIGSWSEQYKGDRDIVSDIAQLSFQEFRNRLNELLKIKNSPLEFKNGIWSIKNKLKILENLGSKIFDFNLDAFQNNIVKVLQEVNPQFEMPKETRAYSIFSDKKMQYSNSLKNGLVEGLVYLGNYSSLFTQCSLQKAEIAAVISVREIFNNATWELWASLNNSLPLIAESAPKEFLNILESTLLSNSDIFTRIYDEEGNGMSGSNYMTGLLWGLEHLAWDEDLIVRVSVCLAQLAEYDPGGNWNNRPINSLSSIFLLWYPQTLASVGKRKTALETIIAELPNVAWQLLIKLLPNNITTTSGTSKPKFLNAEKVSTYEVTVLNEEYRDIVSFIAEQIFALAKDNVERLKLIIENLDDLPQDAFNSILNYLKDNKSLIGEKEQALIWEKLSAFTNRHKKFATAKWALTKEKVQEIENVAVIYTPNNKQLLYRRLFADSAYDIFEEKNNWTENERNLNDIRKQAVEQIIEIDGIQGIIDFSKSVENILYLGITLGNIENVELDRILLPSYLNVIGNENINFIRPYIFNKFQNFSWDWLKLVEQLCVSEYEISKLYSYMPFRKDVWDYIGDNFKTNENLYWNSVIVTPYSDLDNISIAISKLLEYNRPRAAIDCIHTATYNKHKIEVNIISKALIEAIKIEEKNYRMDIYEIIHLIEILQNDEGTSEDELMKIEWAYLEILNDLNHAKPKLLEYKLASEPNFFFEILQFLHKEESKKELSENDRAAALNAWKLLYYWKTPPGTQKDGSFDANSFTKWIEEVFTKAKEINLLDSVKSYVGKVLFYVPIDTDGLWINKIVAKELNKAENEIVRSNFCSEIYNSRGVHSVDPSGAAEIAISETWKTKANEIESKGFHRFATSLKNLADSYVRDAERVKEQFNNE